MEFISTYWQVIVAILGVGLALLYAASQGKLVILLAKAWGTAVLWASDALNNVSDEDFTAWATLIHDKLPVWAKPFISVGVIKSALISLRNALVAEMGEDKTSEELAGGRSLAVRNAIDLALNR